MLWTPDTCGCVLEYDNSDGRGNIPANMLRVVFDCPDHPLPPNVDQPRSARQAKLLRKQGYTYEKPTANTLPPNAKAKKAHLVIATAVLAENQQRNDTLGAVAKVMPKLGRLQMVEGVEELATDVRRVQWSFDTQRNLMIHVEGLTPAEQEALSQGLLKQLPKIGTPQSRKRLASHRLVVVTKLPPGSANRLKHGILKA